jgi:hypothetical protein
MFLICFRYQTNRSKTEILINAKETPTMVNNNLKNQKSLAKGITKHIQLTRNKAVSIEF